MSVENIVSALRCDNRGNTDCKLCEFCKINDEFEVWGCDEDKIKQLAADQLERIQLENERLKAEKPVRCGSANFTEQSSAHWMIFMKIMPIAIAATENGGMRSE